MAKRRPRGLRGFVSSTFGTVAGNFLTFGLLGVGGYLVVKRLGGVDGLAERIGKAVTAVAKKVADSGVAPARKVVAAPAPEGQIVAPAAVQGYLPSGLVDFGGFGNGVSPQEWFAASPYEGTGRY